MPKITAGRVIRGLVLATVIYAGADWVLNTGGPVDTTGPQQATFVNDVEEENAYAEMLGYDQPGTPDIEIIDDTANDVSAGETVSLPPDVNTMEEPSSLEPMVETSSQEPASMEPTYTKDAYTYAYTETALPLYNNETGQIDTKSPDLAITEYYQDLLENVEEKIAINDISGAKDDVTNAFAATTNFLFHNAQLTEYNLTRNMMTEETYIGVLSTFSLAESIAIDAIPSFQEELTTYYSDQVHLFQEAVDEVRDQVIEQAGEHAYQNVMNQTMKGSYK